MIYQFVSFTELDGDGSRDDDVIPVLLISLPSEAGRRHELLKRGMPQSWTDNYFHAVDCRKSNYPDVKEMTDEKKMCEYSNHRLTPAEIGCATSHREACTWLAKSDYSMGLVFEDDVIPRCRDFIDQLSQVALAMAPLARKVSFVCLLGIKHGQDAGMISRYVRFNRTRTDINIKMLFDPCGHLYRAHAYFVSRQAAQQIARREAKIYHVADDWNARLKSGAISKLFYTVPELFEQDEVVNSTVQVNNQNNDQVLFKYSLRKKIQNIFGFYIKRPVCRSLARIDYIVS